MTLLSILNLEASSLILVNEILSAPFNIIFLRVNPWISLMIVKEESNIRQLEADCPLHAEIMNTSPPLSSSPSSAHDSPYSPKKFCLPTEIPYPSDSSLSLSRLMYKTHRQQKS